MSTFDQAPATSAASSAASSTVSARADAAREATRTLAHATRSIDDPEVLYSVVGSMSLILASLSQSLHQLGDVHDGPANKRASIDGDHLAGRASSYYASWELHRAGEMIRQVAEAVDRAHEIEARIAYDPAPAQQPVAAARSVTQTHNRRGLSL